MVVIVCGAGERLLFSLAGFSRLGWRVDFAAGIARCLNGHRIAFAVAGDKTNALDGVKPPDRIPVHDRSPEPRMTAHLAALSNSEGGAMDTVKVDR